MVGMRGLAWFAGDELGVEWLHPPTYSCGTSMLSAIDSRDSAYRANLATLSAYMRAKGVEPRLARRVTQFYHHAHGANVKQILESGALPALPSDVTVELHSQLYRKLVQQCPIFDTKKFPMEVRAYGFVWVCVGCYVGTLGCRARYD